MRGRKSSFLVDTSQLEMIGVLGVFAHEHTSHYFPTTNVLRKYVVYSVACLVGLTLKLTSKTLN